MENVYIQLGVSALIVVVIGGAMIAGAITIAKLLINKWSSSEAEKAKVMRESEAERTKTIAEGFKAINEQHQEVLRTMNEHQIDELNRIAAIHSSIALLNTRVETALDLTPRPHVLPDLPPPPKVIVSKDLQPDVDDDKTPVDGPPKRQTGPFPRAPSQPVTEYGPFTTRPKKA